MKKVLFATTALIATAGVASADITLSGSANMGLNYLEDRARETQVHNEIDFDIKASAVSDNGIEFGASIDLDASEENQTQSHATDQDGEVYIVFNGLKITTGDVGAADDTGGSADVGFDGIGVDSEQTATGDHDVGLAYSMNGVDINLSFGNESGDIAAAVSGSFAGVDATVTYGEEDAVKTVTSLTLGFDLNGVGITAYMDQTDFDAAGTADVDGTGFDVSYTMGAVTYTFAWSDTDAASDVDADYGIGASVDLGGGLKFVAGAGSVNDKTAAEAGFTMSF
jgi:outer membrane protein OmpU